MNDNEYLIVARVLDSRDVIYDANLDEAGEMRITVPIGSRHIDIDRNTTVGELYRAIVEAQPKPYQ